MNRRSLAFAALFGTTLAAQQPSPTVSTSAATPVTLDVRVVDEHGQFVPNLTADDFLVFEDGVEQTLSSLAAVDIPFDGDNRSRPDSTPIAADIAANDVTTQERLYVLMLDDLRTEPSRAAAVRSQARDFIERRLAANDRAVVLTTSGRRALIQEFTNNHQRLLDAVEKADIGARPKCAGDPQACACSDDRAEYQSIGAIAKWLGPVRAERKAVLLFGAQDAVDPLDVVEARAATAACAASADVRRDASAAAARANVNVYPIDARRDEDAALTRVVAESSSYYLLTYVPTNGKHDRTVRRTSVRMKRPGLVPNTRAGYIAPTDAPAKKLPTPPPAIAELISKPAAASGVALAVTAPVFRGKSGKASVEVIVDVSGGAGKFDLREAIADGSGRVKASDHDSVAVKVPAVAAAAASDSQRVLSRLEVPPGKYVLRVAGVGGGGRSQSSVQYDLDVPDFAGDPITMSGLTLSSAAEADAPTSGSDKEWDKRFDHPPTARRAFSAADELTVSGEAYINEKAPGAIEADTMVLRRSGDIAIQTRDLLDADGRSAAYRYESTVALSTLDPGDYLFKVEVRSGTAAASREIPFSVVPGSKAGGTKFVTEPSLREVLRRAAAYVAEFSRKVSGLVAEETYEQDAPGRHRVLKSDFLLVQLPGWAHPVEFRDVFDVDGQPVRDRQDRLVQLFLTPSRSRSQVDAIVAESARYNVGNISRTMNTPMLPLEFLAARVQKGFEFRRTTDTRPLRATRADGAGSPFAVPENAWVVEYREVGKEAVIRDQQSRNIYSYGRFWIDPRSGRVLMSELRADGGGVAVVVDVSYRANDDAGVALPVEMRESYDPIRGGPGITGVARYGNFRQFRVQTDEAVAASGQEK